MSGSWPASCIHTHTHRCCHNSRGTLVSDVRVQHRPLPCLWPSVEVWFGGKCTWHPARDYIWFRELCWKSPLSASPSPLGLLTQQSAPEGEAEIGAENRQVLPFPPRPPLVAYCGFTLCLQPEPHSPRVLLKLFHLLKVTCAQSLVNIRFCGTEEIKVSLWVPGAVLCLS